MDCCGACPGCQISVTAACVDLNQKVFHTLAYGDSKTSGRIDIGTELIPKYKVVRITGNESPEVVHEIVILGRERELGRNRPHREAHGRDSSVSGPNSEKSPRAATRM